MKMNNNFEAGIVWAVKGNEVVIKMFNISSDFKYFYAGKEYEGIRIGGYLSIVRGHVDIICQIESEEIKDNFIKNDDTKDFQKERYERFVYAKCIGYFEKNKFKTGSTYSPIIYNRVNILSDETIGQILSPTTIKNISLPKEIEINFKIGKDIRYGLDMKLPWDKIFNTHIGIFGNTGSGKSNTLTRLYNTLLNHEKLNLEKSKFIFIDFNGEYTNEKVLSEKKKVYSLNTRESKEREKFKIESKFFWDAEVFSILFHATEKTQKPFLKKLINLRKKFSHNSNSLEKYIKKIWKIIFETSNPKNELLELIKPVLEMINSHYDIKKIYWHGGSFKFHSKEYTENKGFFNTGDLTEAAKSFLEIGELKLDDINPFQELQIRARLQLIEGIISNYNQYEHIQPLISKITAISDDLNKIIQVVEKAKIEELPNIEVISLRECNQDIKKLFPILLAKQSFEYHKNNSKNDYETFHLIIDEAHNILSNQSNRESETWKDYRLELFEEIIKEGRKFGFFLTVASQRPADISETLMSQFHNFFIHRLINEKDLRLIDNVISTLDKSSKQLIPSLPQGACILTGTAFDLPKIIQVDYIKNREERPSSDDYDLKSIWLK